MSKQLFFKGKQKDQSIFFLKKEKKGDPFSFPLPFKRGWKQSKSVSHSFFIRLDFIKKMKVTARLIGLMDFKPLSTNSFWNSKGINKFKRPRAVICQLIFGCGYLWANTFFMTIVQFLLYTVSKNLSNTKKNAWVWDSWFLITVLPRLVRSPRLVRLPV